MEYYIQPSLSKLRKRHGQEEWEDDNDDALRFEQGWDRDYNEVEDGDYFNIPKGYEGYVCDEDSTYYYNGQEAYKLKPGNYQVKGTKIYRV